MGATGPGSVAMVATGALVASLPGAAAPAAAMSPGDQHCVLHVVGQAPNGRFITDEPVCYPTLAEALAEAGAPGVARAALGGLTAAELDAVVAAASGTLGVHVDGANRTGSSITVSGGACNGGYVMPACAHRRSGCAA